MVIRRRRTDNEKEKRIIMLVLTFIMVISFAPMSVSAKTITKEKLQKDKDYWNVNNSVYTLYCFAPPTRYGKAFGKASDYTYGKTTTTSFKYVTKKSSKMKKKVKKSYSLLKGLYKVYRRKHFIGYAALIKYYSKDVKGIKIEQSTYYNKHTHSYVVGKNKRCKKDVFKIYYLKKGSNKWKLYKKLDDRYTVKIRLK